MHIILVADINTYPNCLVLMLVRWVYSIFSALGSAIGYSMHRLLEAAVIIHSAL